MTGGKSHPARRRLEKEAALYEGILYGRKRQIIPPTVSAAWRAKGLESVLWEGWDRGRRQAAELEQQTLDV
jgi:hypothetical protein